MYGKIKNVPNHQPVMILVFCQQNVKKTSPLGGIGIGGSCCDVEAELDTPETTKKLSSASSLHSQNLRVWVKTYPKIEDNLIHLERLRLDKHDKVCGPSPKLHAPCPFLHGHKLTGGSSHDCSAERFVGSRIGDLTMNHTSCDS